MGGVGLASLGSAYLSVEYGNQSLAQLSLDKGENRDGSRW